ncbi:MAG: DUF1648 domain-containing protein [Ktedonobacteraceae bacterium]
MSFSNDTHDKIRPKPLLPNPTDILIWALIIMQIIIALAAFPFLPAVVPIHWGANGQPNGYGSKLIATLLFPTISIGLVVLLRVLITIGPRLGDRSNVAANAQMSSIITVGIILFLLIIQRLTTATALGMNISINVIVSLGLAVLFPYPQGKSSTNPLHSSGQAHQSHA